jgi:hypothetical protein
MSEEVIAIQKEVCDTLNYINLVSYAYPCLGAYLWVRGLGEDCSVW